MILCIKQKQITAKESRLVVARREREGVRWTGSLGLVDVNCDTWNGWARGPSCTAQGTVCDLGHFAVQQKWKKHCKSTVIFFYSKKFKKKKASPSRFPKLMHKPRCAEIPGMGGNIARNLDEHRKRDVFYVPCQFSFV